MTCDFSALMSGPQSLWSCWHGCLLDSGPRIAGDPPQQTPVSLGLQGGEVLAAGWPEEREVRLTPTNEENMGPLPSLQQCLGSLKL
jgi:hypothetical protein